MVKPLALVLSAFALSVSVGAARADDVDVENSPFPSEIPGVSVPNAHFLRQGSSLVVRSSAPNGHVAELRKLGVNEVVIFKRQQQHEVDEEIAEWKESGLGDGQIHYIPVDVRDFVEFSAVCQKTLSALGVMDAAAHTHGRNVEVHCKAGEDRTGLLSGLFRVYEDGWTVDRAFQDEMCVNGYEAGDPEKPRSMDELIRLRVTPIFLKLAYLLQKSKVNHWAITPAICSQKAQADAEQALRAMPRELWGTTYACKASPKYPHRAIR